MDGAIGIIGGMGPLATELFYKMVTTHTAVQSDQEHVRMILLSDTSMPGLCSRCPAKTKHPAASVL